jgi:DNA-binding MarR family transcriptional regulator
MADTEAAGPGAADPGAADPGAAAPEAAAPEAAHARPGEPGQQVLPLIEHLARVARRAYEAGHFIEAGCLRPRQLVALRLLHEHGPLSQQALGEALTLDPSNVVGLLNELEERGLVTRQRDPADRRRHIVSLSAAGQAELAATGGQLTTIEDDVLKALSPADRVTLYALLQRAVGGAPNACQGPACGEPPSAC